MKGVNDLIVRLVQGYPSLHLQCRLQVALHNASADLPESANRVETTIDHPPPARPFNVAIPLHPMTTPSLTNPEVTFSTILS